MNDRIEALWQVFAEDDRALEAPSRLEPHVLAVIARREEAHAAGGVGAVSAAFALAAAVAVAVAIWASREPQVPVPLDARKPVLAALPLPVAPRPPGALSRRDGAPVAGGDAIAAYEEAPVFIIMLEDIATLDTEPLQLVRLRVPQEALFGFGMALFEPDGSGLIDVDVLVGEDGLPREVRKVRKAQEEQ